MAGRPLLGYLLDRLEGCRSLAGVVVATSRQPSDNPLVDFCREEKREVVRGSLENVAGRFLAVLEGRPWEAFVRICADSPWLDPTLVDKGVNLYHGHRADLVTNVNPRTFPPGQSVEVVKAATFRRIYQEMAEPADLEHVTRFLYRHLERFKMVNFTSGQDFGGLSLAVDTTEELARFERIVSRLESPQAELNLSEVVDLYQQAQGEG